MIVKKSNCFYISDETGKNTIVEFIYKLPKQNAHDIVYAKVANELLNQSTASLNQLEFNQLKLDCYDLHIDRSARELRDCIAYVFSASFVSPKHLKDLDLDTIMSTFNDFINNFKFDDELFDQVINMYQLELDHLQQNHRALASRVSRDSLLKGEDTYLDYDTEVQVLSTITIERINEFIKTLKFEQPQIIYAGANNQVDLSRFYHGQELTTPVGYTLNQAEDVYLERDLNQAIITLNYRFKQDVSRRLKLLFINLLGGGSDGLLFLTIREEMNLCYYVYAKPTSQNGFSVVLGTSHDKQQEAIDKIDDMVANFTNYLDDKHYYQVVKKLIARINKTKSDPSNNEGLVFNHILFGFEYDSDKIISEYEALTMDEVLNLSEEIIKINEVIVR